MHVLLILLTLLAQATPPEVVELSGVASEIATHHHGVDAVETSRRGGHARRIDIRGTCARDHAYGLTYLDVRRHEAAHGRIPNGAVLIVDTGWDGTWNGTPGLSDDVVTYFITYRDLTGVILDAPVREPNDALAEHGVWHVGCAVNLDDVPPAGASVVVRTEPGRVVATVPEAMAPLPPIEGRKRLVEFGWDIPTAKTLVDAANAGTAFDGTVFDPMVAMPDGSSMRYSWMAFGADRVDRDDVERIIAEVMKAPEAFRHGSLLRYNVTPGDVDWFDDWDAILHNARVASEIVARTELPGVFFDVEQYEGPIFDHTTRPGVGDFEAYQMRARERGIELMRALQTHAADLDVLLAYGYSLTPRDRERAAYGLLPAFLDGMLEAKNDDVTIIDGYEYAYPLHERIAFQRGRMEMLRDSVGRLAVGYGIWMDWNSGRYGWHQDPSENWFTPDEFENAVRYALELTDEWVWVYTERLNGWTREDLPEAYVEALEAARRSVP